MDLIRNFAASINTEKIFDVQLLASLDAASFSGKFSSLRKIPTFGKDTGNCILKEAE